MRPQRELRAHSSRLHVLIINYASPARISEGTSSKDLPAADLSVLRSSQWVCECPSISFLPTGPPEALNRLVARAVDWFT